MQSSSFTWDNESKTPRARRYAALAFVVVMLAAGTLSGADQDRQALARVRAQIGVFESVLNTSLNQNFPGPFAYLDRARGAYLPGYGVIFTCEINLTRPVAPFDTPVKAAERNRPDDQAQRRAAAKTMSE